MAKINILGVEIDNLSKLEIITNFKSFLLTEKSHFIATLNPEIILEAKNDKTFERILNQADLSLVDGIGLKLASIYLGKKLKQRMTGVEAMIEILRMAANDRYTVYLLGGHGKVAEKCARELLKKFPNLRFAGFENGFRFWGFRLPDSRLVEKINLAKPDILFVAFGAPKQEKWLYYNLPKLKTVRLGMGVGGAFDYFSKKVRRAPKIVRKLGLEWFWRLIRQPWRLPRIINATVRFSIEIIKSKKQTNVQ